MGSKARQLAIEHGDEEVSERGLAIRAEADIAGNRFSFSEARMTGTVDEILLDLLATIDRAQARDRKVVAAALERIRAIAAVDARGIPKFRKAADAFGEHFAFDDQKVRRLCRANAIGKSDGKGFAQMIEGTWHVKEPEWSCYVNDFNASDR